MTSHNLREHLLWLTQFASPPTLPDYCQYRSETARPEINTPALTDLDGLHDDLDAFALQKDEEESLVLLESAQVRPLAVVGEKVYQDRDAMAKLRLGNSSAKKQLISQQTVSYSSPTSRRQQDVQRAAPEAISYTHHDSDGSKHTSSTNHVSSSSNVETWDEGQILWNEEVASRPEPPLRRKRRSTDLEGESVSGSVDSFSADFLDIDTLPLPSTIHGLLPPPKKQKFLGGEDVIRQQHDGNIQTSIAQSSPLKPKESTSIDNSSPAATIKQTPQVGRHGTAGTTSKRAQQSRVVIDSEDESGEVAGIFQPSSPTVRKRTKPSLPVMESIDADQQNIVAGTPRTRPEEPNRGRPITRRSQEPPKSSKSQLKSNDSLLSQSSPSKKTPRISQNTSDIDALASSADMATLQLVLDCVPERLKQYIDILLERRARFALRIQQMLLDGQKITSFAEQCDSLHEELDNFDQIIKFKAEYLISSQERTRARINIGIAAESEQSTELYVQQSKNANRQCQEISSRILDLLASVSAEFKSDISNPECQLVAPRKIESKPRGVIVQSTQASPVRRREMLMPIEEAVNNLAQSQYVMQTPQAVDDETIDHESWQRDQPLFPPRLQSTMKATQRQRDTPAQRHMLGPGLKSRSPRRVHEDFDEFYDGEEDDADYLAAVEQAESLRKASPLLARSSGRHVLQPITGNPARTPTSISSIKKSLPQPKPSDLQHPWSKDLLAKLHNNFKMKGFRENQLEAINSTLAGNDTFVLMPTGGGKSLCYQLPAVLRSGKTQGVTIVVSPLLSLMEDQVEHLQKLQIQAFYISGDVSQEHKNLIMQGLRDPDPQKLVQLLYITPEMINKNLRFVDLLRDLNRRQRLARIVIDEAHCVSQWGHDFRPDYKTLGTLRAQHFPNVPVLALTATATEMVKTDVQHNLGMNNCRVFSQSFNRPNLTYEILPKPGTGPSLLQAIVNTIRTKHNGEAGIIYCFSRKNCEDVATNLYKKEKIQAAHYHAGMSAEERSTTQKRWQSGQIKIIVATIAFGMGIDKPDVRFVIHQSVPWTLEGYYQETGRAGRDGELSHCYLYFSSKDAVKLKRMVFSDKEIPQEQKERKLEMLKKMEQFCQNHSDCRRSQILNYFNERFTKEQCNATCDNCWNRYETEIRDYTDIAAAAVGLVHDANTSNLDKALSVINCIDAFVGSKSSVQHLSHLKHFGHGKSLKRGETERLFYHLLLEDAIQEKQEMNRGGFPFETVTLGRRYRQFAERRIPVKLEVVVSKEPVYENPSRKKAKTASVPWSTNVPSPQRKGQRLQHDNDDSDSDDLGTRRSGYRRDELAVGDDSQDEDYFESQDEPESQHMQAQSKTALRTKGRRELGSPITIDERLNQLDEVHLDIVEAFVSEATKLGKKILLEQKLSKHPFTVLDYRAMAIDFPKDLDEMERIPGIDAGRVRRFGAQYLPLIAQISEQFDSICPPEATSLTGRNKVNSGIITISDDEGTLDDSALFTHDDFEDNEDFLDNSADSPSNDNGAAFTQRINNIDTFGRKNSARGGKVSAGTKSSRGKFVKRVSGGFARGNRAASSSKNKASAQRRIPKGRTGGSNSSRSVIQQRNPGGGISAMET